MYFYPIHSYVNDSNLHSTIQTTKPVSTDVLNATLNLHKNLSLEILIGFINGVIET